MSANLLTLIVGIVGVLASYFFFWLGGRTTKGQNSELHNEIADLKSAISKSEAETAEVRSVNRHILERIDDGSIVSRNVVRPRRPDDNLELQTSSRNSLLSDVAVEELIRASLGALINERGDVDVARLRREVAAAVGPSYIASAMDVLRRMRDQGVVSWDGDDDLSQVRTLHLMVPHATGGGDDLSSIDKIH